MPKFEKEILTEGLYVTGDGNGGRKVSFIPEKRIKHWIEQHRLMTEAGLKVPAPEAHADDEDPRKYVVDTGSKSNFGFWESLSLGEKIGPNGERLAVMKGELDVPVQSDADRIGTSVQETSIYAKDKFVDGTGKEWNDVLVHISPCVKPIEPGQSNFVKIEDNDLAIAMSSSHRIAMNMTDVNSMLGNDDSDYDMKSLSQLLKDVAGVCIPDNVSPEELHKALMAALQQKQLSDSHTDGDGGTVTTPPKDSKISQVPIVMATNQNSQQNQQAGQQSQQGGAITPGSPQNTDSALPADQNPGHTQGSKTTAMSQLESQNQGLLNVVTDSKKKELIGRLNALRQRGIVHDQSCLLYTSDAADE